MRHALPRVAGLIAIFAGLALVIPGPTSARGASNRALLAGSVKSAAGEKMEGQS